MPATHVIIVETGWRLGAWARSALAGMPAMISEVRLPERFGQLVSSSPFPVVVLGADVEGMLDLARASIGHGSACLVIGDATSTAARLELQEQSILCISGFAEHATQLGGVLRRYVALSQARLDAADGKVDGGRRAVR